MSSSPLPRHLLSLAFWCFVRYAGVSYTCTAKPAKSPSISIVHERTYNTAKLRCGSTVGAYNSSTATGYGPRPSSQVDVASFRWKMLLHWMKVSAEVEKPLCRSEVHLAGVIGSICMAELNCLEWRGWGRGCNMGAATAAKVSADLRLDSVSHCTTQGPHTHRASQQIKQNKVASFQCQRPGP
ncbi:hypothetical protein AALO_G00154000 [Alosa alosa]|uniref:Secreted protein n=1 Tax=Alosa alosa TaxID=278164 RepID=A0AAV6GF09_9TELE|nr:hypothetical protein AALO_G00154000 [Alosa alosa]